MSRHPFLKYQLIICLIINICLIQLSFGALRWNAKDNLDGNENQLEDINKIHAYRKFKCPGLFGVYPDVKDCSKYYLCVGGLGRRMPCPPFTNFDKYKKKCISILIAICDKGKEGKTTTVSEGGKTTAKETSYLCPSILGSFPHPHDCDKYYSCALFISTLKTCPEGKLYDVVHKECRPESEVNCGLRNTPTNENTRPTSPLLPKTSPEITTPEITTPKPTTPKPTVPEATTTEKPTTSEPTTTEKPTTPVPATTEKPTTTEVPTITEVLTTPELTTTEKPTTTELTTFEEPTAPENDCDEDDLDCIITETGEFPPWFKCPVALGSYRHPSSRKLFIFCINWEPYVKKCGQDLVYSLEMRTCVPP